MNKEVLIVEMHNAVMSSIWVDHVGDIAGVQSAVEQCAKVAMKHLSQWIDYDPNNEPSIGDWFFLSTNGKIHNLPAMYTRYGEFIYSDKTRPAQLPDEICKMYIPEPPKQ